MTYQCIYCKASYNHDSSYKHNAYDCPRVKRGRGALAIILSICLVGLTGCEALQSLLPKPEYPANADRAEVQFYKGDKVYKFVCTVNVTTKALTDCREVN